VSTLFKISCANKDYLSSKNDFYCYGTSKIPEPNAYHALTMGKFARDCMFRMHEVTRSLEVSLGPDTGDLSMRMGIHSGPVTAGVLRGERSRFQLFGDTGTLSYESGRSIHDV
jgi:Adenylate and Guanylate cyclase catalytic domain